MDVSREGGFLHRSVLGGAARLKDPIYSGRPASLGRFRAVKDELSGGMAFCIGNEGLVCCAVLEDMRRSFGVEALSNTKLASARSAVYV